MATIIHRQLSDKILGISFTVHNILGPGLLESVYEGAFCIELAREGLPFERQKIYPLHYRGDLIGAYIADIVVDNAVICELKSVTALNTIMSAQIINYWSLPRVSDHLRMLVVGRIEGSFEDTGRLSAQFQWPKS